MPTYLAYVGVEPRSRAVEPFLPTYYLGMRRHCLGSAWRASSPTTETDSHLTHPLDSQSNLCKGCPNANRLETAMIDLRYNLAPYCDDCAARHERDDCPRRLVACDSCGELYDRDDMFWCGDMLVSDCCDSETDPRR